MENNMTVEFREVPGFEGYCVGDNGTVWTRWRKGGRCTRWLSNDYHEIKLKVRPDDGYLRVVLKNHIVKTAIYVHRLILLTFVGPCPKGMEGCHNDGNRSNNKLSNLRWDTLSGNQQDRKKHITGRYLSGQECTQAKLTEEIVQQSRIKYNSGKHSLQELADELGVHKTTIHRAIIGNTWKHLE